jgi:hypothetical protein
MKVLNMQFPPTSYYFIPVQSIYYPQHRVPKYPQSVCFYKCERPSFTPMQNYRQNYNRVCLASGR